jgi:phage protein D
VTEPALDGVRDAPRFEVLVDGRELDPEAALDVIEVSVCDAVVGSDCFTVLLNNWDSGRQRLKWLDDRRFREGVEVELRLGYVDSLAPLIVGEVTALEPEFPEGEAPRLRLQGYDRLHRFQRGRKTRTFTNVKDSEIAERIARELGLAANVQDSGVVHEYVLQHNRTDVDFLCERARRIHYEVRVEGRTLSFRETANARSEVVSLEYGFTLRSFYPRLTTLGQVSEVVVRGWNPKTKEPIAERARRGDETTTMGGSELGVAAAERAFFATEAAIVERPVASAGEALQMARGKFREMALGFVTGEATAIGDPVIRAGTVVELTNLGERFSGLYYVTSSEHRVDAMGYVTTCTVERNAA